MKHAIFLSVTVCTFLLGAAPACLAQPQSGPVSLTNPDPTGKSVSAYWTAERFKAAKPLPLPQAVARAKPDAPESAPAGKVEGSDAQAPSLQFKASGVRLYSPDPGAAADRAQAVDPGAVGVFGAHYTSTRVFPLFTGSGAPFSADRAYPYTTVGMLFFSIDGSPYVCSASVIQRRVVATAGHCVHSGTSGGFHNNWVFVPAFRDGTAPFMVWTWRYATVTGTWATGGGGVPNAADYAMIEFGDQPLSTGGAPVKLGNVTGWLGWQTLSLDGNHTSKLGYPCNLDGCLRMQNVMSSNFRATAPNNVEYGSDARGGSSGGPWVQNFQTLQSGGASGSNTGSNRIVGVTSYGYVETEPKVQGASILDSRWVQLWNTICGRTGNCTN